jgi:hypothetical protein
MRFFTTFLLVMVLGYAAYLFANETPWWLFVTGAFLGGLAVPQSSGRSFMAGFAGIFVLWLLLCLFTNAANQGIMSSRMAAILPLQGSPALLIIITALIGGLLGGMASLSGSFLRKKPVE